jgi:hypothetical protein
MLTIYISHEANAGRETCEQLVRHTTLLWYIMINERLWSACEDDLCQHVPNKGSITKCYGYLVLWAEIIMLTNHTERECESI